MMARFNSQSRDTANSRGLYSEVASSQSLLVGRVDLAALLDIATATLDRLDSAGKTPAAIKLGGRKLWRRVDVDEWVKLGCPDRKVFETLTKSR